MHGRTRSVFVALVTTAAGAIGFTVIGASPSNAVDSAPDAAPATVDQRIARVDIVADGVTIATFPQLIDLTSDAPEDGVVPPPTVVLRRPLGALDGVHLWHQALVAGDLTALRGVVVDVSNADGVEIAKYFMEKAAPWQITVTKSKAPVETVTFQAEQLLRIQP